MDHEFLSIVEKLAILEGRIAPKDNVIAETATKQKKPALFANLKKDESAIPMVGGVEFAEEKSTDVLSQVKASLADYLKSTEKEVKQDKELIAKKKQDLDLKKKELKDLELQQKKAEVEEAIPDTLEEAPQLSVGDPICVIGPNEYQGEFGVVEEFSPSGKFVVVKFRNGDEASMHLSDVELTDEGGDDYDTDDEDYDDSDDSQFVEDPNQTPAGGEASSGMSSPTYAESAPVKTVDVPLEEMGGSVLVEIHGDERSGFKIKRAGRELPTVFASLEEAEMALEMFNVRRAAKLKAEQSADYIEEK